MDILFLLIPLSVVLAVAIGVAFWMAVDGGQFDDLEAPAIRVLADDDTPPRLKTETRRSTEFTRRSTEDPLVSEDRGNGIA